MIVWQFLIKQMSDDEAIKLCKLVLKTRKRVLDFSLNGKVQLVKRSEVLKYLETNTAASSVRGYH